MSNDDILEEAALLAALNEDPTPCEVFALIQGVE
jgi:hypothetical protein